MPNARLMFRARFRHEILTEFLPPAQPSRIHNVFLLCDGMPSIPRKQPLASFLAQKGYWVFYPRYRGTWESGGEFLRTSPHIDILEVIDELPKGVRDVTFGENFSVDPDEIYVIGGSFGGAASILASLDPRVNKAIANCPVVDWSILAHSEQAPHQRVLQPRVPRARDRSLQNHDVPRSGRSLRPVQIGRPVCRSDRNPFETAETRRTPLHRSDGPPILGGD